MMFDKNAKKLTERPSFYQLNIKINIRNQTIQIKGPIPQNDLIALNPADGLNGFRPVNLQHQALVCLAGEPDGMVFTACDNNILLSYVTFQKSDFPWWQKQTFRELIELGAMETDPHWRRKGLTTELLKALFNNRHFDFFEKMVIFTVQTVSNWDLCGSGLSKWEYRRLMIRFFKQFNFNIWQTADPEIIDDPCNFLLARIGKKTPEDIKAMFSCCCEGSFYKPN